MFEVEKKFALNTEQIGRITDGAEFSGEKTFTDIYWDDQNHSLTTQDIWLRQRDSQFELKIPLNTEGVSTRMLDQYEEITEDEKIREELVLQPEPLATVLKNAGYSPFCAIETTRRTFRKGNFRIDADTMDFGYSVIEIELLVQTEYEMNKAFERIMALARENKLPTKPVLGKVIEWIRRHDLTHYQALVSAGVV